jgi:uncharacterized membrane protein YeaQ/YmgE (transglycosylase-associated protein family)
MQLFTVLVVGCTTGLLASLSVGGAGYGLPRSILIGGAGALLANWLVGALGVPSGGVIGTSVVAFMGAVVLFLLLRVVRHARRTRELWTRHTSTATPWRPQARR